MLTKISQNAIRIKRMPNVIFPKDFLVSIQTPSKVDRQDDKMK